MAELGNRKIVRMIVMPRANKRRLLQDLMPQDPLMRQFHAGWTRRLPRPEYPF
jgi:hypothetical protein